MDAFGVWTPAACPMNQTSTVKRSYMPECSLFVAFMFACTAICAYAGYKINLPAFWQASAWAFS
jgi:hypothetical protein